MSATTIDQEVIDAVTAALHGRKGKAVRGEIIYCCTRHDDEHPSAAWNPAKGTWYCHSTCKAGGGALDLARDLGIEIRKPLNGKGRHVERRVVASFDYGEFLIDRIEPGRDGKRKDFMPRLPGVTPGDWGRYGIGTTPRTLYRYDEAVALAERSGFIVVVEGEAKVDACQERGIPATCNPFGAGKWEDEYSELIHHDLLVIVLPDRDKPGQGHGQKVAESLRKVGRRVKIATLPGDGNDVVDFFRGGGTAEELRVLLEAARPVEAVAVEIPKAKLARPGAERFTDSGNAARLIERHGPDIRYCFPWAKWIAFDGQRWDASAQARIERLAKETARSIFDEAKTAKSMEEQKALSDHAIRSLQVPKLEAMLKAARCEVETKPADLDRDSWALNCMNGTVDLRNGEPRPHRREDLLTKLCPTEYDPAANAPTWEAFLERIQPDEQIRAYLKRLAGYALAGNPIEDVLPLLYGDGANGKTTFLNGIREAVGPDYSHECAPELLLSKRGESHPTEVADLWGRRIVTTVEVEQARKFAEVMLKKLTGRDPLTARRMREDFWTFNPTHVIFVAANYKPIIEGTDAAIWRRIRLVPFTVTIPKADRDTDLAEKLKAERKGILRWLVEGCLEWQGGGLLDPPGVLAATEEYRVESDILGSFIADRCIVNPRVRAKTSLIFGAYTLWHSETEGGEPMTQKAFGTALGARGFRADRDGSTRWWKGIAVLDREAAENDQRFESQGEGAKQ